MTIAIRKDISIEDIYAQAKQEDNGEIRARLLGIAAVIEGKSRTYAAKFAGLTINNFRTWIQRYNEQGFAGLINKKQPGKQSTWTEDIEQYLKSKVIQGADFEVDNRVSYRLEDLQDMLEKEFDMRYGISTIWYKLQDLNLSWISVRP